MFPLVGQKWQSNRYLDFRVLGYLTYLDPGAVDGLTLLRFYREATPGRPARQVRSKDSHLSCR